MPERRANIIRQLETTSFDLLVIGGGITGAGIARDAALRGLRTVLLEQDDFASGTSSRSSRLIHGGVRYLEHGHLHLVFESCRERRTLLRVAPHLVRPLDFTWPVYRGARISRARLYAGLALYDALALFRNLGRHRRIGASAVRLREPALRSDDLLGGALYYDASTDDARLTLANVLGAGEAGAIALNHASVMALERDQGGRAAGVAAADTLSGTRFSVRARVIVNATGPWTDGIQRLENPRAAPSIVGSKGAHIAVPRKRVGNAGAITMLHPRDGRVMFTLPAGPFAIFGTTETPADAGPGMIRATREDVAYLLDGARAYFPRCELGDGDVVAAWAGIRPLAAALTGEDRSAASREHTIHRGPLGVLSVTGGKLTTYRAMAEEVVDDVGGTLNRRLRRCLTTTEPLPGGDVPPEQLEAQAALAIDDAQLRTRLVAAYGSAWRRVWQSTVEDPMDSERILPDLPYVFAELRYAVAAELACTLGDLLIRRTHIAFEDRDHGLAIASRIASYVGPLLGWSPADQADATAAYEREVERIFGAP